MSKTTMTILAAVAAVVAVLVLGVVIGFAVDSDDVAVAEDAGNTSTDDPSDDGGPSSDGGNGQDEGPTDQDDGAPGEIDDFGALFECLTDAGLGLEDLNEFDVDVEQFLEECLGGLLGGDFDFSDSFDAEGFDPFAFLEEFFTEGGDGGLGGFEEFFDQFDDVEGFPFDQGEFEDFFKDLFEDSDQGT